MATHGLCSIVNCTPPSLLGNLTKQDRLPECNGMIDDVHIQCHIVGHTSNV